METIKLLNIDLDNLTMNELLEKLSKSGGFVVTPNVDHLIKLQIDTELLKAYKVAEYCVCDSKIIQYILKFLGTPIKEKISGSDFFPAFYEYNKDNQDIKIFLLGAQEGVAHQAQININEKVGREIIVDTYSPSFGFENNEAECQEIIDKINQSGATVIAVGLGAPKQEKWILNYKNQLTNIKIFLAIGATIDFEAGYKPRAPKWMSDWGLEWLYRLLSEPQRLWKRYLVDSLPLMKYITQQKLNLYKFSPILEILALPLGKRLRQAGLISDQQLQEVLEEKNNQRHRQLGEIISEKGLLPEEVIEFMGEELDFLIENNYLNADEVEPLLQPKTKKNQSWKILALSLEKRLQQAGLITEEQLQEVLEEKEHRRDLQVKEIILEKGLLPEEILDFMAEELDFLIKNDYLSSDEVHNLLQPNKKKSQSNS